MAKDVIDPTCPSRSEHIRFPVCVFRISNTDEFECMMVSAFKGEDAIFGGYGKHLLPSSLVNSTL